MHLPLPVYVDSLFSFCSTHFQLYDDNYVLKAMELCDRPQSDIVTLNVTEEGEGSSLSGLHQLQVLPSVPGILKVRVEEEK
jgi:transcription factor Dp-1